MKGMPFAAVFASILLGVALGCRASQQPPPASSPVPASTVPTTMAAAPQPVPPAQTAAAPSPARPFRYSEPPVDDDVTAGVRGTQMVKFVVLSEGKRIEGAHITVLNAHGKSEGDGTTDDWGEFHVGLAQARYKVSIDWQGKTVVRQVTVAAATQSVDLKLD